LVIANGIFEEAETFGVQVPDNIKRDNGRASRLSFRGRTKKLVRDRFGELLDQTTLRSIKIWFVMAGFSLAMIYGGHKFGSRFGLLVGFLMALSANSLIFFYSDIRLAKLFEGKELEGRDPWELLDEIKELSVKLGLRPPQTMLLDTPTPLIYSAGLAPTAITPHRLFISLELLKRLTKEERRALLAYELVRLKTQVTAAATAISAINGFFISITGFIDSLITFGFLRRDPPHRLADRNGLKMGPLTRVFSPIAVLLLRLSLSRRAVYEVDEAAARLIGNPEVLGRAIWKMDSYAKTIPLEVSLAEAHLFVVNPFVRHRNWLWAIAQPSTSSRLKRLCGHEEIAIDL
jgi:Zn-dependent protease with chaperone function